MTKLQLKYFPDYSRTNPYQTLLYQSAPSDWTIRPGDIHTATECQNAGERTVFHLNWTPRLFKSAHNAASFVGISDTFLNNLKRFQKAGGIVVWTLHNRLPHHCPWPGEEAVFRTRLAAQVDIIHLHDRSSVDYVNEAFHLPEEKIIICPHGHFIDHYKGRLIKKFTRRKQKMSDSDIVFGCFGQLRPSKGIESFIDAATDTNINAIIAGKVSAPAKPGDYKNRTKHAKVRCIEGYLNNKDLFDLIKMTNWIVLPYQDILTSGSLILAASLKKPIILPDLPGLGSWCDQPFVRTYPAGDIAGLKNLLSDLDSQSNTLSQNLGQQAFDYVSQLNWTQCFQPLFDRLAKGEH